jgi:hypothetical protein
VCGALALATFCSGAEAPSHPFASPGAALPRASEDPWTGGQRFAPKHDLLTSLAARYATPVAGWLGTPKRADVPVAAALHRLQCTERHRGASQPVVCRPILGGARLGSRERHRSGPFELRAAGCLAVALSSPAPKCRFRDCFARHALRGAIPAAEATFLAVAHRGAALELSSAEAEAAVDPCSSRRGASFGVLLTGRSQWAFLLGRRWCCSQSACRDTEAPLLAAILRRVAVPALLSFGAEAPGRTTWVPRCGPLAGPRNAEASRVSAAGLRCGADVHTPSPKREWRLSFPRGRLGPARHRRSAGSPPSSSGWPPASLCRRSDID